MQRLANPIPVFLDLNGRLIDGGKVYVGVVGDDPETDPVDVYWDPELTNVAAQPLRTIGGMIVNGTTPANVFVAENDYSMRLRDANNVQVFYSPSVFIDTDQFQPRDADLTAIADQGTTAYGRGLLALNNQAALKSATGIPDPLPAAGGTVSGPITRQGAGVHAYALNPAFTGFRLCGVDPTGTADATSQPGDFQVFY